MSEPGAAARRGFAWHLGVLLAMRLAAVAANAAFYVLAARLLGIAVFGRSAAFVGVAGLLSVAADFGTSSTVTRDAASQAVPPTLGPALRRRATGAAATAAVGASLSAVLLLTGSGPQRAALPLLLACWPWLITTQSVFAGLLIGRGRTWLGAVVPLIEKGVSILLFLLLPLGIPTTRDVPLRMSGSVIGGVALSAVVAGLCERQLLRRAWSRPGPPGQSRQSFGFFAGAVGAQVQNLDVTLVGWVAGGTAAGLLAAPSRMTTPLLVMASAAAAMMLVQDRHPRAVAGRDRRLAVVTASVGLLTFVSMAPLLFFPAPTINLVLGHAYLPAAGVCRLVAVATCIAAVNQPLAADGQARFDQARVGFAIVVGATVGVLTLLLSAPHVGAVGGGWAMIATQIVVLGLLVQAWRTRAVRLRTGSPRALHIDGRSGGAQPVGHQPVEAQAVGTVGAALGAGGA